MHANPGETPEYPPIESVKKSEESADGSLASLSPSPTETLDVAITGEALLRRGVTGFLVEPSHSYLVWAERKVENQSLAHKMKGKFLTAKSQLRHLQKIYKSKRNRTENTNDTTFQFLKGSPRKRCSFLEMLPRERLLGCGCVSCTWQTTWRNRTLALKVRSRECKLGDLRGVFMNQIHFAQLRITHRNLATVFAVCEAPERLAMLMELVPGSPFTITNYHDEPLHKKLQWVYGAGQLLLFLSTKHTQHPGSPYFPCDLKAAQFGISEGGDSLKMFDFDTVIPMSRSLRYRAMPYGTRSMSGWKGGRMFVYKKCTKNKQCYSNCLFGHKYDVHEMVCQPVFLPENSSVALMCPGVSVASLTAMYGLQFLTPFLANDSRAPQRLRDVSRVSTSRYEWERPSLSEVLLELEVSYAELSQNKTYINSYGDLTPLISVTPSQEEV